MVGVRIKIKDQDQHQSQGQRARAPALHEQRKMPRSFLNMAFIYAGNYLLSHTLSRAIPSAQRGLTSVFGMGSPVSPGETAGRTP
jgi:hypothetical protein